MLGPHCDGVLRLVTNRLDLPAELIAEISRLGWIIEMFFRTFKQLLGLASLEELEASINTRMEPAPVQPRPHRHAGIAAARLRRELSEGLPMPSRRRRRPAKPGRRERRHLRANGDQDDRSERPARGCGQPRAAVHRRLQTCGHWRRARVAPSGGAPQSPSLTRLGFLTAELGADRAPRAGVADQRSQDGGAQSASSERRAGCPQRASGDGVWAAPSGAAPQVENLRPRVMGEPYQAA